MCMFQTVCRPHPTPLLSGRFLPLPPLLLAPLQPHSLWFRTAGSDIVTGGPRANGSRRSPWTPLYKVVYRVEHAGPNFPQARSHRSPFPRPTPPLPVQHLPLSARPTTAPPPCAARRTL